MKTLAAIVVLSAAFVLLTIVTRPKPAASQLSAPIAVTQRHANEQHPAVPAVMRVSKKKPTVSVAQAHELNAMPLNQYPPVVYRFEGMATCDRVPCPEAQVSVRVLVGSRVQTQAGVTGADGSYTIPVSVSVPLYTPLEWTMEAHTADYRQVELTGRRIVTDKDKEDGKAVLQIALALL